MPFETISLGLTLTIPTSSTKNWGSNLKSGAWQKISGHDHTGSGNGVKLSETSLSDNLGQTQGTTLTPSGTTQTIDFNTGNKQILNLGSATGTVTLTLSNPKTSATYRVKLIQGATPRALVWPAAVKFQGAEEPGQYMDASSIGYVTLDYDGTVYLASWEIGLS